MYQGEGVVYFAELKQEAKVTAAVEFSFLLFLVFLFDSDTGKRRKRNDKNFLVKKIGCMCAPCQKTFL